MIMKRMEKEADRVMRGIFSSFFPFRNYTLISCSFHGITAAERRGRQTHFWNSQTFKERLAKCTSAFKLGNKLSVQQQVRLAKWLKRIDSNGFPLKHQRHVSASLWLRSRAFPGCIQPFWKPSTCGKSLLSST